MQRLLDGRTKESIGAELGIQQSLLIRYEVELEAKRQHKILTESYLEGRKQLLPQVLHCGLNLIANAFNHAKDRKDASGNPLPLTLQEAKIVSDIISSVDNMVRLDAGDPTQIVDINRTIPATFKDMVAAFKRDPFIDTALLIKEIDYTVTEQPTQETPDEHRADTTPRKDPLATEG